MIDQRAVRSAEQSVAARRLLLAAQWSSLRARVREEATRPAALGTAALVGGIFGWRSGAKEKRIEVECKCPEKVRASILGDGMRALAIASLQAVAAVASEEFLRSATERARPDDSAADGRAVS